MTSPDARRLVPSAPRARRVTDLLGMGIVFPDGREGDQVIDVRLSPGSRVPGVHAELEVSGFLVGRMRPGTLFGYDRHPDQGPWMVRTLVRRLHRHTRYVDWADVASVDWDAHLLRLRVDGLRDVTPAHG
jgi:hypothetical protein